MTSTALRERGDQLGGHDLDGRRTLAELREQGVGHPTHVVPGNERVTTGPLVPSPAEVRGQQVLQDTFV